MIEKLVVLKRESQVLSAGISDDINLRVAGRSARCERNAALAQIEESVARYLSQLDTKPRTYLAYRRPVILAEIGNRLVIGNQPAGEPHHLNVAARLTLKPAARLNPIEIAVDVELQQHRRMVRRPAGCLGIDPAELSSARSSSSTKTSITRTGLSSQIQSSRHSGNSVLCPRSAPSTKRFIRSLRKSRRNHTGESLAPARFYIARVRLGHRAMSARCPDHPQKRPCSGHSGSAGSCQ